jgi:hypothetical protein
MTKEIDWEKIDSMFIAGCNIEQTAAALGCSRDCLYARCLKEKNTTLSAYHQEKRSKGDALLHAAQYQKAYNDKNPTMLIWLGKQRLNQKDHDQITINPEMLEKHDAFIAQMSSLSSNRNIDESMINNDKKS